MIRLGLRLTLAGGREAMARLVITALATALGVGMLLTAVGALHAVNTQNDRYAWLETGADFVHPAPVPPGTDPVWWALSADEFQGRLIGRVDVGATGAHPPVPPGLARLPAPGEFYASPALARLLRVTPPADLAARFPGRLAGTIGAAGLPSPDSLLVVVGRRPDEAARLGHAQLVRFISTTSPSECVSDCLPIGIGSDGMTLVLGVVAAALLFPILIFVGAASRLSAARREQRFAALRLVGATPRQITVISAVESSVAAAAGVVLGFGLYYLARPVLAAVPLTGERFYRSDIALQVPDVLLVVLGVPLAAAVAARIAMRRVTISPLGVSRRTTPPRPRAWRVLPLLAGLAELGWFVHAGRPATTQHQLIAYLSGILVTMAGLIMAGPWLTDVGARLLTRRTGRPAVLLAGRRLGDDPRAGFRAVSGLVLALFVASVSVGIMATISSEKDPATQAPHSDTTLVDRFGVALIGGSVTSSARDRLPDVPATLVARLRSLPGVRGVTLVRGTKDPFDGGPNPWLGIVRCADLAATPVLGRCPAGATAARIIVADPVLIRDERQAVQAVPDTGLDRLPVSTLVVDTSGPTLERVRTYLERTFGQRFVPLTPAEEHDQLPSVQRLRQFQRLADVVVLASLIVAGCSLAVSVSGGLAERKRPFSLLRLCGTPLGALRRVVLVETGLPLLALSALSAGVGFLAAGLFVDSQLQETLRGPGTDYYVSVGAGVVLAVAVIASTLPLLERLTGPETARNG